MRNDGIRPAFACLKIVILETVNMLASSSAVKARPIRSIRSGSDIRSAVLFWGLHGCIYLLSGFTQQQLPHTGVGQSFKPDSQNLLQPLTALYRARARGTTYLLFRFARIALISRLPESESLPSGERVVDF
jgi:hypothetical protein